MSHYRLDHTSRPGRSALWSDHSPGPHAGTARGNVSVLRKTLAFIGGSSSALLPLTANDANEREFGIPLRGLDGEALTLACGLSPGAVVFANKVQERPCAGLHRGRGYLPPNNRAKKLPRYSGQSLSAFTSAHGGSRISNRCTPFSVTQQRARRRRHTSSPGFPLRYRHAKHCRLGVSMRITLSAGRSRAATSSKRRTSGT